MHAVLDGTQWMSKSRGSASARSAVSKESASDTDDEPAMDMVEQQAQESRESPSKGTPPAGKSTETSSKDAGQDADEDASGDNFYDKFTGGFEGTFADLSDYFGGLEKMIGECRKDLMTAMEEEHCTVATGYGASDETFVTSSYRVTSTPREEWHFVVAPSAVGDMDAGTDRETGRSRGNRIKVLVEKLLEQAAELMTSSFTDRGFGTVVTPDDILGIELRVEEVIALRLTRGRCLRSTTACFARTATRSREVSCHRTQWSAQGRMCMDASPRRYMCSTRECSSLRSCNQRSRCIAASAG